MRGDLKATKRTCALLALAWLALITVAFTTLRYFPCDFGQYYMGGVIARHGLWADLYPDPIPGSKQNVGEPEGSVMKPDYARLAHETRADDYELFRFTQPPPAALAFLPFAYLPFFPAYCLFMGLMVLSTWAIALQAGAIYERCAGGPSRWSGVVVLIVALSPISYRILRVANISPLIGALVGAGVLSILSNRAAASALAIVIGGVLKYATAVLIPVMAAMRQWRAIAYTAIISAAVVGASVLVIGSRPFEEFAQVVFPNMTRAVPQVLNQSLEAVLIRAFGMGELSGAIKWLYRGAEFAMLALIIALLFRSPRQSWTSAPRVCAACAAMISWLLIFSPVLWIHYLAYVMPLWGWLIWEIAQPRRRIPAVLALAMTYIAIPGPLAQFAPLHLQGLVMAHVLVGVCLIAALAIWRLAVMSPVNPREC